MLSTFKFIWKHPISSANRGAALSRYVRWQVGTRLLGAPVVMPFVESTRLVCERSMTGATGNLYCGLHEFGDMAFLLHFLRPGDVFVDVGANVGSFSILASGVIGAHTVALEPVASTFASLKRNIAVNDLEDRITSCRAAAGPRRGCVRFSIDRGPQNSAVDRNYPGESEDVPMMPLDEVTADNAVTLLKVDAEGSEGDVLAGASRTLRNPTLRTVLLESDSDSIASIMRQAGFARALYAPVERLLDMPAARPGGKTAATINNLWVRDVEFVRDRCRTARQFTVYGRTF